MSASQDWISTISASVGSDVILVPQGSGDSVYDINSAPLVNFHHYERSQQEFSQEVDIYHSYIAHPCNIIFLLKFLIII